MMKYKFLWLIINNIQTFDVDFKINLTNQNVHVVSQLHSPTSQASSQCVYIYI